MIEVNPADGIGFGRCDGRPDILTKGHPNSMLIEKRAYEHLHGIKDFEGWPCGTKLPWACTWQMPSCQEQRLTPEGPFLKTNR